MAGQEGGPPPTEHTFDELYDQFLEIGNKLDRQNALLKLLNTVQLISGHGLPRSKYWQWFQKNSAAPGQSITTKIKAGEAIKLITDKELPSNYGWFHSFDFLCDSGNISLVTTYSSGGQTFQEGGKLQDFWAGDFNPRMPASAGDPIVSNQVVDEPAGSTLVNWAVRTSPSFNIPFNAPFSFVAKNTDSVDRNILGYDLFFIMLRKELVNLIEEAEVEGLIYGQEAEALE